MGLSTFVILKFALEAGYSSALTYERLDLWTFWVTNSCLSMLWRVSGGCLYFGFPHFWCGGWFLFEVFFPFLMGLGEIIFGSSPFPMGLGGLVAFLGVFPNFQCVLHAFCFVLFAFLICSVCFCNGSCMLPLLFPLISVHFWPCPFVFCAFLVCSVCFLYRVFAAWVWARWGLCFCALMGLADPFCKGLSWPVCSKMEFSLLVLKSEMFLQRPVLAGGL